MQNKQPEMNYQSFSNLNSTQKRRILSMCESRLHQIDKELSRIEEERIKIEKEKNEIEEIISQFYSKKQTNLTQSELLEYTQSWSWSLKVRFALDYSKKCLKAREIVKMLYSFENFKDDPIGPISSTLSQKISKGIVFEKYYPYKGSRAYYGLKEWFEDGELKEEYKPTIKEAPKGAL